MILAARYDETGARVIWWDTTDRLRHDITTGVDVTTVFSASENALADALAAAQDALDANAQLRDQLVRGIAAFTQARDDAQADVLVAQSMQADAAAYQSQAQALAGTPFTAAGTYQAAQLQGLADAVKATANRQALVFAALSNLLGWRAAVDDNAVRTDNAVIWLGTLAGRAL